MRNKEIIQITGLSFLTILFFCLSFPPADLGYFGWFALVPWFILIIRGKKHVLLSSYLVGLFFFFHRAFMAAACYLCGVVVIKSLLCALFPLLCFLHSKGRFKTKVTHRFCGPMCVDSFGIYTILSLLWVSLVFRRPHSIPLFAGNTNM